jgi:hypothetical protein
MTTWLVTGHRGPPDNRIVAREPRRVFIIVDSDWNDDEDGQTNCDRVVATAEREAGGGFTFNELQQLLPGAVPYDCKRVLFTSEKQLYARVPDLDEAFELEDDDEEDGE